MRKIIFIIIILLFAYPLFSKNIAVIPFQNINSDKEKNWIGAGFSETLTTKLVKIKEINLLERENLSKILEEIKFQYTDAVDEKTVVEKGKIYGVDVMVFGSYQVMGDTLRVNARFVDIKTRKIIDTAEVAGKVSDIFKLQDEIAFNLIDSLKIVLNEKEKEDVTVNPTENLTAYEWFSRGIEADNLALYDNSIEYYTKAIAIASEQEWLTIIKEKTPIQFIPLLIPESYYNRGIAYYYRNFKNESIKDLKNAADLGNEDEQVQSVSATPY